MRGAALVSLAAWLLGTGTVAFAQSAPIVGCDRELGEESEELSEHAGGP